MKIPYRAIELSFRYTSCHSPTHTRRETDINTDTRCIGRWFNAAGERMDQDKMRGLVNAGRGMERALAGGRWWRMCGLRSQDWRRSKPRFAIPVVGDRAICQNRAIHCVSRRCKSRRDPFQGVVCVTTIAATVADFPTEGSQCNAFRNLIPRSCRDCTGGVLAGHGAVVGGQRDRKVIDGQGFAARIACFWPGPAA